jgi:hypothetical protein
VNTFTYSYFHCVKAPPELHCTALPTPLAIDEIKKNLVEGRGGFIYIWVGKEESFLSLHNPYRSIEELD